jgi:hypothetical protein
MNQYGYLILAYVAAGVLYGGYATVLCLRERALRRAIDRTEETWGHGRIR